jgi:hypothetical protein
MNSTRPAAVIGKVAVVALSGMAALGAALLSAMYATVIWGWPSSAAMAFAVFAGTGLAVGAVLVVALVKLPWQLRAVVGVVLLAGVALLLPRPTCATEASSHVEC